MIESQGSNEQWFAIIETARQGIYKDSLIVFLERVNCISCVLNGADPRGTNAVLLASEVGENCDAKSDSYADNGWHGGHTSHLGEVHACCGIEAM